jgi:hypothetical protein
MLLYIGKLFLGVRGGAVFFLQIYVEIPAYFRGFSRRFTQSTFGMAEKESLGNIIRQHVFFLAIPCRTLSA